MSRLVPKLRFKEFSGEWDKKPINKILTIGSGRDYKHLSSGDIPVYGTGGYMLSVNDYLYDGESVCIGRKGTIDKPVFLTGKFWTVDTLFYTHSYMKNIPKFIYLLFQKINWYKYNEASGVPSLSKVTIGKINIFIPKPPEQQKIANCLSSLDNLIEAQNKKVETLKKHKKGLMQGLFPVEGENVPKLRFEGFCGEWEEKSFSQLIIEYRLGGNYSNSEIKTKFPLIKMGNISRGKVNLKKLEYIIADEKIYEIDKIQYGDLFFNTRNTLDLVGKVAIWKNELQAAYYNSNLMYMKFNNNYFMNYKFNTQAVIKDFKAIATGSTSVAAIYTKDLLKVELSIPKPAEQQKIANCLSSLDNLIESQNKKVEALKKHKKGLMQQMFVGSEVSV